MEDNLKCCNCGNDLDLEDVFDHEGGIMEGFLIENQVWSCPHCQKEYIITQRVDFEEGQIIYKRENI